MATAPVVETMHIYHAQADVLSGHLRLPLNQKIPRQAPASLSDRREGFFFQRAEKYSMEGLISFESGYTHVSGSRSLKNHGWVTLATSVLEGLNVLDVITADRLVAQLSTEHPLENGHVPHVTFLGTQIENLRIGGYPVKVEFNLGMCGDKPEGDLPYLADPGFLRRVTEQCERIVATPGLPTALRDTYDSELAYLSHLNDNGNGHSNGRDGGGAAREREPNTRWGEPGWTPEKSKSKGPSVKCSLVSTVSQTPVSKSFGNVLEIPGFGFVSLAELDVSDYFELKMLNMHLGCIGDGHITAGTTRSNGQTAP